VSVQHGAEVRWVGDLPHGSGEIVKTSSGNLENLAVSWAARVDDGDGGLTTPEELVAAGLSACFAMSVAHTLGADGVGPGELKVASTLTFEPGVGITAGTLTLHATVDGLSDAALWETAERAKAGCPVVNALKGVELTLDLPGVERPATSTTT